MHSVGMCFVLCTCEKGLTRAAGVGGEHPHERGGEGGEYERPHYVEEVADDVCARPLPRPAEHLGPRQPLTQQHILLSVTSHRGRSACRPRAHHARTVNTCATYLWAVAVIKSGLVAWPAALLPVEPESLRADAELEVCHPRGADVDHAGDHSRAHAYEQHANPSRPRVVGSLKLSNYAYKLHW